MKAVRFADGVKPLLVPIEAVQQHGQNPNNGDLDALIESIQVNGFVTAVTADARTGNIIAGNHRYQALHALGATEIPVIWVDHMDEGGAVRYMVADNRTGKLAVIDESAVAALLTDLNSTDLGLAGTGYDEHAYQNLLLSIAAEPEIPVEPGYGPGEAPIGIFQVVLDFENEDDRDYCFKALTEQYEGYDATVRKANL
jgi:ParB-like chromosome segregation protein Spo0J